MERELDGPWADTRPLVRAELEAYLAPAADPDVQHLPTRCPPWTVRDLTAHLAETFARYRRLLARSRDGDLSPPFPPDRLAEENLRAVAAFRGDPLAALSGEVRAFLTDTDDLGERMAHQLGPIPVGLQVAFGLNELAVHHDDLAVAAGRRYRPPDPVVEALVPVWERAIAPLPAAGDRWAAIIAASGR